jgi:hypothetical protein
LVRPFSGSLLPGCNNYVEHFYVEHFYVEHYDNNPGSCAVW